MEPVKIEILSIRDSVIVGFSCSALIILVSKVRLNASRQVIGWIHDNQRVVSEKRVLSRSVTPIIIMGNRYARNHLSEFYAKDDLLGHRWIGLVTFKAYGKIRLTVAIWLRYLKVLCENTDGGCAMAICVATRTGVAGSEAGKTLLAVPICFVPIILNINARSIGNLSQH
jgi:hypothetical protein